MLFRSEQSSKAIFARPNPALWWIVLVTLAALATSLYVMPAAAIFRFEALSAEDLVLAIAVGAGGVVAIETARCLGRRWRAASVVLRFSSNQACDSRE